MQLLGIVQSELAVFRSITNRNIIWKCNYKCSIANIIYFRNTLNNDKNSLFRDQSQPVGNISQNKSAEIHMKYLGQL